MSTNMVRNNPAVMAALEKNILEHISLMAQEQLELGLADTIQQIPMMQQHGTTESTSSTTSANDNYGDGSEKSCVDCRTNR